MRVNRTARFLAAFVFAAALFDASAAPGAPSESGPTKSVAITDPILNMRAYSLTVPANWVFDGAVIQGSSCVGLPFAVFRASSPDGLTGVKSLPRLDWAWSDDARYAGKPSPDCLAYKREIPAADVLKYMVGVLKVAFVKNESTPRLAEFRRRIASMNTPTLSSDGDMASASVQYHVNNILIDERLDVSVLCHTSVLALLGRQHSCSAFVTRARAPHGSWSADTFTPIGNSLAADPQWQARWTAIMIQNVNASGAAVRQAGEDAARLRTAKFNAFNQAQSMRQRQHEDFLASMQRGTTMSMQRAAQSANANHRMAGDWADYSLDQQKRLDPATGAISKDSSAYSYTWVNQSGRRVQTNDINANPNGNGTGNWTLQENVH
jgi:hypothetical protein